MYASASTEPLETIQSNECEAVPGLATSRFQALWNEMERRGNALLAAKKIIDRHEHNNKELHTALIAWRQAAISTGLFR